MKNILIATDFSDNAGDALDYAINMLGGTKANLHIIHIVQLDSTTNDVAIDSDNLINEKLNEAKIAMEVIEDYSKMYFGNEEGTQIKISTSVSIGSVANSIKEKAAKLRTDLIIMGTQGSEHSFMKKMLGSISTHVITLAPCPVILVPRGYKLQAIDNIIFATNLNHSDPYELWRATELIKPYVDKIRCLHVLAAMKKVDKSELETFASYMIDHSPSMQTIFNVEESDSIERTLSKYTENYDAEIIIMHRSKKTIWKDPFGLGHTRRMSSWIRTPLMILEG